MSPVLVFGLPKWRGEPGPGLLGVGRSKQPQGPPTAISLRRVVQCLPPAFVELMIMPCNISCASFVRAVRSRSAVPCSCAIFSVCLMPSRFSLSCSKKSTLSAVTQPQPFWSNNGNKFSRTKSAFAMPAGKFSNSKKPNSVKPSANSSAVKESDPSSSNFRNSSHGPPNFSSHQLPKRSRIEAPTLSMASSVMQSESGLFPREVNSFQSTMRSCPVP
mmetsp:Transcript_121511/g.388728  ORF Transcript_121511/g.388728 Transcript_121511/m.388728 type:complete len:217 (-) Transcript_121511:723-1373(-)